MKNPVGKRTQFKEVISVGLTYEFIKYNGRNYHSSLSESRLAKVLC